MTPSNKPGADQVTDDSDEQRTSVINKAALVTAVADSPTAGDPSMSDDPPAPVSAEPSGGGTDDTTTTTPSPKTMPNRNATRRTGTARTAKKTTVSRPSGRTTTDKAPEEAAGAGSDRPLNGLASNKVAGGTFSDKSSDEAGSGKASDGDPVSPTSMDGSSVVGNGSAATSSGLDEVMRDQADESVTDREGGREGDFDTVIVTLKPSAEESSKDKDNPAASIDAEPESLEETRAGRLSEDELDAVGAGLPPWRRVSGQLTDTEDSSTDTGGVPLVETEDGAIYATDKFDKEDPALRRSAIANAAMTGAATIGRTSVTLGEDEKPAPSAGRVGSPGVRRSPRGPRRASLQVKRVDPWSVLKLALVLSVVLFFVWLVAVGVLYIVLDGMGTWNQLNGAYGDLVRPEDNGGGQELISAGRVFGAAALVGAVNIILFTALATVSAFVYNIAADLVGGVEVTLSERE